MPSTVSKIEVRPSRTVDADALARVVVRSIQEICAKDYSDRDLSFWLSNKTPENLANWIQAADRTMVTGLLNGNVAGVGMLMHDGWIRLLYVAPEALHLGLGKAMLKHLEQKQRK